MLAAPFRAAGANPILLHNLTLLSACVLSGVTMFLLVGSLTGDGRAALFAALAFTASPLRIEHYPRVQLQLTYLMPLALYFLHRILEGDGRKRAAVLAGVTCGLLFYSCVYYLAFFLTLLPIFVLLCLAMRRDHAALLVRRLALAAGVTVALIGPGAVPYLHNRGTVGERHVEELRPGSAQLRDYGRPNPANWLYGDAQHPGIAERNLFTGYVLPAVAVGAIASPVGRWLPYAGALVAAIDLSLGVNGRGYAWLYRHAVPYRALRVPARFAVLVNMLLAILGGLGCAALVRRLPSERMRTSALVVLAAGVLLESVNRPLELRDMPKSMPVVYEWLRTQPEAPILEYPVDGLEGRSGPQDPTYMYYSTAHWRPLLNGYSGFSPASYHAILRELRDFPSARSLDYLRARGVRYLLVHERFYLRGGFEEDIQALSHAANVTIGGVFRDPVVGRSYVYELRR